VVGRASIFNISMRSQETAQQKNGTSPSKNEVANTGGVYVARWWMHGEGGEK
jgi:hypothetical protein